MGGRPGRAGARAGRPARRTPGPAPRCSACTAARTPPTRTGSPRSARLWVDAGFAVVEVNYRGSTGYGSAWRDAIEGRPGLTELEDVAAVVDTCVAAGHRRPATGAWSRAGRGAGTWRCWRPGRSPSAGPAAWPACRWPTTSPRTTTRWSRCGRSTGRCSAGRPRRCPSATGRPRRSTYVDAGARAGARAGRGERPALPDPPGRQLPRRAGRARGRALRGQPVRRGPRLARGGGDDAPRRDRDRLRPPGLACSRCAGARRVTTAR